MAAPSSQSAHAPHALSPARRAETLTAWALVLPVFIGFVLFYALPTLRAIGISLTDWNLLRAPKFVGLANYATMLQDGKFWQGMKLSVYYVALNIPPQTVLGLFLAVAIDRLTRSLFVKSIVLLPYLLSNVLVAMMWLWMLDPLLGLVNSLIDGIGFGRQPFFGGADQALLTVAAVSIWRHMGLVVSPSCAKCSGRSAWANPPTCSTTAVWPTSRWRSKPPARPMPTPASAWPFPCPPRRSTCSTKKAMRWNGVFRLPTY
ncbi:MAG: sugar ABC transporter permease [Ferruginibacter sp.]|nr:sugar ABC transporter permease [Rhodoferax sp.]